MTDKKEVRSSKTNLNESTLPLLDTELKGETPEKEEQIELESKSEEKGAGDEKPEKEGKKKKEKKVKPPKEPSERKPRTTPLQYAQNVTIGLNVLDRDEKSINSAVNVHFDDVLGEPDANQGFEFIWRLTFMIFNAVRFWTYRVIATVLAVPFAIFWALVFASINVVAVWGLTPLFRVYDIVLHHLHRIWSGLVRSTLDPVFTSAGLFWANARRPAQVNPISVA